MDLNFCFLRIHEEINRFVHEESVEKGRTAAAQTPAKMKETQLTRINEASSNGGGTLDRVAEATSQVATRERSAICNVVLLLVACITALNSYFVYLNRPGPGLVGPFGQPNEATHFQKTFIFWLPDFKSDLHLTRGTSPEERKTAEEQFTRTLTDMFGGWTRWRVEGTGGDALTEGGYFYQVSLPKEKPDATVDSIKNMMADAFDQITYYVIEIRHR